MLKKVVNSLVIFFLLLNCFGGGRVRDIKYVPSATIIRSDNYKFLDMSEGESSTFFYFGLFPVTNPLNIEYAMSKAVEKVPGGDSIVNMIIWQETQLFFPLGTVSVIKVKGDVVSLKANNPLFEDKKKSEKTPTGGKAKISESGGISVGGKK
jgi:hypothetical protein